MAFTILAISVFITVAVTLTILCRVYIAKYKSEIKKLEHKIAFIGMSSHEVKNLSYEISCTSQALKKLVNKYKKDIENPSLVESLEVDIENIRTASATMGNFVYEMIEVNKIKDLSSIPRVLSKVNLVNAVRDVFKIFKTQSSTKGISVEFHPDPSLTKEDFYVFTDTVRVKQILLNLVGNAIKYTDEGFVHVILSRTKDNFSFTIKDSGIGIPSKDLLKVQKLGHRGSNVASKIGSGFGLPSVIHMIKNLEGTITITSKEGEGTEVSFTLPDEE